MSKTNLSSFLKKKLWFITGKGGVGKTTLTAALGLLCARQGLRTLLVETHGLTHLGQMLQVGKVGYRPKKIQTNLSLLQLTPEQAFEEYVLMQVRFQFVYDKVFNNRYVRHFIDAAPGLTELLTIGKIWSLTDEKVKGGMGKEFDIILVDAPSTGHGLSMLQVSQVVLKAIRVGPLKTKAEQIQTLLQDPEKSTIWLTTLAEEMPVNEAIEMKGKLKSEINVPVGPILLNCLWPKLVSDEAKQVLTKNSDAFPLWTRYQKRDQENDFYRKRLEKELSDHPLIELPLVYEKADPTLITKNLSKFLEKEFFVTVHS